MRKKFVLATTAIVLLITCIAYADNCDSAGTRFEPLNERHQSSYAIGRDMGITLRDMGIELDMEVLIMALREGVGSASSQISDSALTAINSRVRKEMSEARERKRRQAEETNLAAANKFMAKNKKAPGVVTTKSGLQYMVITEGTGKKPTLNDKVKVHYHGTLTDGTVFDSSVERDEPVTFPLTGVIAGWTEALQLMKVGGKYKIFVPPDLAYGKRGVGTTIEPNMALIFEIELLGIN